MVSHLLACENTRPSSIPAREAFRGSEEGRLLRRLHICSAWENTAASWIFYIDGSLWWNGDGLETELVIDSNGILILGQDQDIYGENFEQSQSFFGQMYGRSMWDKILRQNFAVSTNCTHGEGNYLRWSDFVKGLNGNLHPTCLPWTEHAHLLIVCIGRLWS